jgi:NADH:ubiquinone oxidoreductase subunit
VSWSHIETELSDINLEHGGKYMPTKESTTTKVAIIVPYKNRLRNLKTFIRYMHRFLSKQNMEYGIYLVEPVDGLEFNRAYLINIGFTEALKDDSKWNCFFFHDVDLLPEMDINLYTCQNNPTQFAISVNIYNYSYV